MIANTVFERSLPAEGTYFLFADERYIQLSELWPRSTRGCVC